MARKVKISDADVILFGICISHSDGKTGWLIGPSGDYLLFENEVDAEKALRKLKRDDHYSWNCVVKVSKFFK